VAGSWRALPLLYHSALSALTALEGTIVASAHQSHAYIDGGCLYFTFAGRPGGGTDRKAAEHYYRCAFDAVLSATTNAGGTISHHHGIGLNRSSYMANHLGPALDVLAAIKTVLDPNGILNPGKLGLPDRFRSGEAD
jgi:alkyldihydroxyacetonephosphate synthase